MDENGYICKFCGRVCKNSNSQRNHERLCKENPDRQISYGNKGHMPEHTKAYYTSKLKIRGDEINITRSELDEYAMSHCTCEICGKLIGDCVKWESKYAPKHFCVDHDHKTLRFRGLLCSACNRQLGWFEKHQEKILSYLKK